MQLNTGKVNCRHVVTVSIISERIKITYIYVCYGRIIGSVATRPATVPYNYHLLTPTTSWLLR